MGSTPESVRQSDAPAVVRGVLDAESSAIETCWLLVDAAREAGDPVTEGLAVTLPADEETPRIGFRDFEVESQN
jgi:hypothetical protein